MAVQQELVHKERKRKELTWKRMNREWNSKRKDSLLHSSVPALPGSTNPTGCYDMTWCTKRSVSYLSLDSLVLRTSLNTSEMIWEMPELLIVITDIWLIWFFKWICVLDTNIWIKLSKITARSSVPQKRADVSILETMISNAAIGWRQDGNVMTSYH